MTDDADLDALEARIRRGWREPPAAELDARWKAELMRSVHARSVRGAPLDDASTLRLVRNALLASAAAAVIAVAASGGGLSTLDPTQEIASAVAGDPQALLQLALVLR